MSRASLLGLLAAMALALGLATFLTWAVLTGGYPAGVVLPAVIVLGVPVAAARAWWAVRANRPGRDSSTTSEAERVAWALALFILGVLMGWLCAEIVGYLLLPVLWLAIVPRARRRAPVSATLPPFGLGFVIAPLFFLASDISTGGSDSPLILWFVPELAIGVLLIATYYRHRQRADNPQAPRLPAR